MTQEERAAILAEYDPSDRASDYEEEDEQEGDRCSVCGEIATLLWFSTDYKGIRCGKCHDKGDA